MGVSEPVSKPLDDRQNVVSKDGHYKQSANGTEVPSTDSSRNAHTEQEPVASSSIEITNNNNTLPGTKTDAQDVSCTECSTSISEKNLSTGGQSSEAGGSQKCKKQDEVVSVKLEKVLKEGEQENNTTELETSQVALTKAFAPPAYDDLAILPSRDSSVKSTGSLGSSKEGSLSEAENTKTTPGSENTPPAGWKGSQRSQSSSRFTITPSLKDPLKRVKETTASPLTRHKVSAASTIASTEAGSTSTRLASSASSVKEDDNTSILDDVFWAPLSFRSPDDVDTETLEPGDITGDSKREQRPRYKDFKQARHQVTITIEDTEESANVNNVKRRVGCAPRPLQNPKPNDYILLSCIVTCCCNPILGIIAMVFAFTSNGSYQDGDVTKATRYSHRALLVCIVGILTTAFIAITLLIVYWPSGHPDPTPMDD